MRIGCARLAVYRTLARAGALLAAVLLVVSCEDTSNFDHTPPAGSGSLIVDNRGFMNVSVFVDGALLADVRDGHWSAFDLAPGLHRLVLDETNGDRAFRDDVDILDGRQTIASITTGGSTPTTLGVSIFFDN